MIIENRLIEKRHSECPSHGWARQKKEDAPERVFSNSKFPVGAYFIRSKVFCKICQSFRSLTFSFAALLIAASLAFLVGLFTL